LRNAACKAIGTEQYVRQHGSGAQHREGGAQHRMPPHEQRTHLQVGIVSTLESHWVVLDAELSEIRKDFAALRMVRAKKPPP